MERPQPFVSVLTPVYNGEEYLRECIESVLGQTHTHFEYLIVNNKSTDATLAIAQGYAARDARIRVVTNERFVDVIENHNIAFSLISPESRYCKVLSADDWLYPECIERMVQVAERHPSVDVVGAYAVLTGDVHGAGVPVGTELVPGKEACRLRLLGAGIFGPPTTVLYRAARVRSGSPFFSVATPNADIDTTFKVLQHADFGFVHQVLSFIRVHDRSVSSRLTDLESFLIDKVEFILKYGPECLTPRALQARLEGLLRHYYEALAVQVLKGNGAYWRFHRDRRRQIGMELSYARLVGAVVAKVLDLVLSPRVTAEKIGRRVKKATP